MELQIGSLPKFSELPVVENSEEKHAWDVFGREDQRGTLNFLTPECTRKAMQSVTEGRIVNLSLPLDHSVCSLAPDRSPYHREILRSRLGRDDYLDGFYPQGSSQWDALSHIRYREHGYFGGRQEEDIDRGELGVHVIANKGVIGRAVVADVEPILTGSPNTRQTISAAELDQVLFEAGVTIQPGDVLILHTGWLGWYESISLEEREGMKSSLHNGEDGLECPGLHPGRETAAWLWDNRISAVAADNPTVEALKVRQDEGFLHRRLIALLGMPLGELWNLGTLMKECRERSVYTCALVSAPCNVSGGAGSPSNAYALF